MRIRSIHIGGYGRFSDRRMEFAPGLQLIVGPNEAGKSTVRGFVADMLYGQKQNETQPHYEESNALRAPWNGADRYGGRLQYELDSGGRFEVVRVFDKHHESIQVFDPVADTEVTGTFSRYRNRELDFARRHLGLPKDVFLSTATIAHTSLNDLGDSEALDQIRETLRALADAGWGTRTAGGAVNALAARIAAIGRPDAPSRPLPRARQAQAAFEDELRQAREQQAILRALATDRKAVLDECAALQQQKHDAEAALRALDAQEDRKRLEHATDIQFQIENTRQGADALDGAPELLDADAEVQDAHRQLEEARRQLETTRAQYDAARRRRDAEQGADPAPDTPADGFPPALENRITEAMAAWNQLADQGLKAHTHVNAARERMDAVQQQLADMPDFSRLAADPVEWLSQLASSFAVAQRARDEECALCEALRREVEKLEDANIPYDGLFGGRDDIPALAREYEAQRRANEEEERLRASELHSLQLSYDEAQGETKAFLPIGAICLAIASVLGVLFFTLDNRAMLFGALVALAVGIVFLGMRSERKGHLARLRESIAAAEAEVKELAASKTDERLAVIVRLLEESGLDTVRELEAQYEHYRATRAELRDRREALAVQEEKTAEAEERIPLLLDRFRDTFAKADECIETEDDVADAAGRAIARYQAYREAKRNATANRAILERHETELARLEAAEAKAAQELEALEKEARLFAIDSGFPDADQYTSVKELIAGFNQSVAEGRAYLDRQGPLDERLQRLESQIEEESANLEAAREHCDALFGRHGVADFEAWNRRIAAAREHRGLLRQMTALEDRLADILGEDTVKSLRERVARHGPMPPKPDASRDALHERIAALNEDIEQKFQEEHALHEQIAGQSVRTRALAEIEEDIALVGARIRDLEAEVEATSYAMAVLEDVARDRHAEIAPELARKASEHLAAITGGHYTELTVKPDLSVGVRVPETDRVEKAPEQLLRKGAVDQIYFALRLAFVQCVSENGESIPMLLDDPFANYDEGRLEATLTLLAQWSEKGQILLFTCREDLATVAERLKIPIIRL